MPSLLLPQHTEAALCCWLWEATSAGNSTGCQVTFRTVWSKSACSTRRTEAALWLLPSGGSAQPGRRKKKRKSLASECHSNTSFSETRNAAGSSFPVSKCSPNISSYRVIGFSSPSFLRGLTVLHPNSYLEKAATRQIKLHCGFLAPESDIGNSAHPTNQSQQPRHVLSQDGKPDLRG